MSRAMYIATTWNTVGRGFNTVMNLARSSFHISLPKKATANNIIRKTTKFIHDLGTVYPGYLLLLEASNPSTPEPITLERALAIAICITIQYKKFSANL